MVERPLRRQGFPPGSVTGLAVVAAAAVAVAVLWWLTGRPTTTQIPVQRAPGGASMVSASPQTGPQGSGPPAASPGPSTGTAPPGAPADVTVTVDVRGRVESPGIRRLPAGSRVMDAVQAAGGLRPGHHYGAVNLARVLVDGEQIRVGIEEGPVVPPEDAAGTPTPAGAASAGTTALDLNTATAIQLEEVDGVGPVLAAAIVRWRTDNGPFQSVEDLLDVSGIGEATLAGMRDQVTVG